MPSRRLDPYDARLHRAESLIAAGHARERGWRWQEWAEAFDRRAAWLEGLARRLRESPSRASRGRELEEVVRCP